MPFPLPGAAGAAGTNLDAGEAFAACSASAFVTDEAPIAAKTATPITTATGSAGILRSMYLSSLGLAGIVRGNGSGNLQRSYARRIPTSRVGDIGPSRAVCLRSETRSIQVAFGPLSGVTRFAVELIYRSLAVSEPAWPRQGTRSGPRVRGRVAPGGTPRPAGAGWSRDTEPWPSMACAKVHGQTQRSPVTNLRSRQRVRSVGGDGVPSSL